MRARNSFWIAFAALAVCTLPLFGSVPILPLMLVGSLLLERSGWARPGIRVTVATFLIVGLAWLHFWNVDLGQAQVRYILIALPFPGLLIAALKGARSTIRDLLAGVLLAMGPIFCLMALRADNGCTGVSGAYSFTLAVTAPALFILGPSIFAELVSHEP